RVSRLDDIAIKIGRGRWLQHGFPHSTVRKIENRSVCCSGGACPERWLIFRFDGFELRPGVCPSYDLKTAVGMLGDGRAAFDPISTIDIAHTEVLANSRVVNVAADDLIDAVAMRLRHQRFFVFTDVTDGVLDLQFRPLRERPVTEPEAAAHRIEH